MTTRFRLYLVAGSFSLSAMMARADPLKLYDPWAATGTAAAKKGYVWNQNVRATVFSLDSLSHDVDLFYVALPFDDLAHPDLAKKWVPKDWIWPTTPGKKPVSNCLGRWVELKNNQGEICYAEWEGFGPGPTDDADYVFGPSLPRAQAGIMVSRQVARYLAIDAEHATVCWRFVEAREVPPGYWLKYEEQAVLFPAMREADAAGKTGDNSSPPALTPASSDADFRATYLSAYLGINGAEQDERQGKFKEARDEFLQVQAKLESLRKAAPRWETALVIKRAEDVHSKIDELSLKVAAGAL